MSKSSTHSDVLEPRDDKFDKPSRYSKEPNGIVAKTSINSDVLPQSDIKIDIDGPKRYTPERSTKYGSSSGVPNQSNRSSNFVYVNSAYVGSLNSVSEPRTVEPPTGVYREQYWACSKWPMAQKLLAIAVGILFGAVLGMMVSLIMNRDDNVSNVFEGIFRSQPAPD